MHRLAAPPAVRAEHEVLHRALAEAIEAGGDTGTAAAHLARIVHRHFLMEERYALPPLALLPQLAKGAIPTGADEAQRLVDALINELPGMLVEHRKIDVAIGKLVAAASRENQPRCLELCRALQAHAREEEEVLYPAAVLVGKYLKLAARRGAVGAR